MAQDRSLTPEKQLLKLIEDSKSKNVTVRVQTIKHHSLSLLSFGAWIGRISFLREGIGRWIKDVTRLQFDVKLINKILAFLLFLLGVYFITNLSSSFINLRKAPQLRFAYQKGAAKTEGFLDFSFSKTVASNLEKIRSRDIFKMGAKKAADTDLVTRSPSTSPSARIMEATSQLKLVGISWSADPDAMIEDAKATRTFFVKRGQLIGDIKVQAIMKDKVILSYGGEEIELR